MQTKNPLEFFRNLPPKQCTECSTPITEQAESYLLECDHCLSKRQD
ncbi:protein YhfH [Peribacillus sp. Bi96]|nr:protein YhfH [Peribacillus sp. Bi96]